MYIYSSSEPSQPGSRVSFTFTCTRFKSNVYLSFSPRTKFIYQFFIRLVHASRPTHLSVLLVTLLMLGMKLLVVKFSRHFLSRYYNQIFAKHLFSKTSRESLVSKRAVTD
jgi:hypothetical protein